MSHPTRLIARRGKGHAMGPIIRLMNPGDLGELIKPFVFLDLFEMTATHRRGFAPHPHSGIATLTTFLEGKMTYRDTTGKRGAMADFSVEWMRAGSGVWHDGEPAPGHKMRGFQLWVALPPELELAPPQSLYLEADHVEEVGPARVLLGSYDGKKSPVDYPVSLTYLYVQLKDGEQWTYLPANDHEVAWLATNAGRLRTGDALFEREIVVFTEGNGPIELTAEGDTEFVIGSAAKHPYPLVTGSFSVHTSRKTLSNGEKGIAAIRNSEAFLAIAGG